MRRQQKRQGGATRGRRQKKSGRRSAELRVPTRRAYFLEGRGGGIDPGRGTPGGEGFSQVPAAASLLRSQERKVFSRRFRPARTLRTQSPSLRSGRRPSPAPGKAAPRCLGGVPGAPPQGTGGYGWRGWRCSSWAGSRLPLSPPRRPPPRPRRSWPRRCPPSPRCQANAPSPASAPRLRALSSALTAT